MCYYYVIAMIYLNTTNHCIAMDKENYIYDQSNQTFIPEQIIIQYPRPQTLNENFCYQGLGSISPEEVEYTSTYKCCPSPYNDSNYNKRRRNMCLSLSPSACCIVGCKLCLMYNECICNSFSSQDRLECYRCLPTHTCQEIWWPTPCDKECNMLCITGIGQDQVSGISACPGTCTIVFIINALSALYALMPCHNRDGCNPCKKVVKKVLRKKN